MVEIEQRHSPVPIAETFAFVQGQGYAGFFLDGQMRSVPLADLDLARKQALGPADRRPGRTAQGYVSNHEILACPPVPHRDQPRGAGPASGRAPPAGTMEEASGPSP